MPVLVDTNVLSDVIHHDPVWSGWSSAQLIQDPLEEHPCQTRGHH